jgi:hypothetical protein
VTVEELQTCLGGDNGLYAGEQMYGLEAAVRAVMQGWDFREPTGWRHVPARVLSTGSLADPDAAASLLSRRLEEFAGSDLRATIAAAAVCRRQVEYALPLGDGLPGVQGRVDLLWRDRDGRWDLLAVGAGDGGHLRLVLAAEAFRREMGAWPCTATIVQPLEGSVRTVSGSRLAHRRFLAMAEQGLKQLARRPVNKSI